MITKEQLAAKFDKCQESACNEGHHTEKLFSNSVTAKIDKVLSSLTVEERELALALLSESARWDYYHDSHNYEEAPFNEDGYWKHGLTSNTCPCGCGEY